MAASTDSYCPDETGSFKLIARNSFCLVFCSEVPWHARSGRMTSPAALYQGPMKLLAASVFFPKDRRKPFH